MKLAVAATLGVALWSGAGIAEEYKYRCQITPNLVREQNEPCVSAKSATPARQAPSRDFDDSDCRLMDPPKLDKAKMRLGGEVSIRKLMKDPESARFNSTVQAQLQCAGGKAIVVACGLVNSKNSFGGYGGDKRWLFAMTAGGGFRTWTEEEKPVSSDALLINLSAYATCMKFGD